MSKIFFYLNVFILTFTFSSFSRADNGMQLGTQDVSTVLSMALKEDLNGDPHTARALYDRLIMGNQVAVVEIPSAINHVRLGQYEIAKNAIADLMKSDDLKVADYAALWDLWLTAKLWNGSALQLKKMLQKKVASRDWHSASEELLASLYSGKSKPKNIYSEIKQQKYNNHSEESDAITQALFFTGGYLTYVQRKPTEAIKLYAKHASELNENSLEKPFIIDEMRNSTAQ